MVCKLLFRSLIFTTLICLCSSQFGYEHSVEPNICTQCMNNRTCVPPNCFCCRDEFRLPISVRDIPQIVFFTFDDALTDSATKFYHRLFNESRKNPNGCPVSMTLFVSHHDTVYSNVNLMYRKGMEIAAHSVSHSHMSNENFMREAQNQKINLAKLGAVPENEIVGWRSPFLEPVGDMQPNTLKKLGYTYDATLTFSKRSLKDKAPTPFTLDFGWPYDCKVKPCPKRRHFGFWEVPVVSLLDYLHQYDCVYVDGCNNPPPDEQSAFKFLMDNFNSYYSKYRVPFGINMHPSWFYIPERLNAMDRFIKKLSNMDDVFIVSVKKMIEWLKNPTGLSQLHNFKPWQCQNQQPTRGVKQHAQWNENQNDWSRQPDPVAQRRNYIQARLERIQAMRQSQQQALSRDLRRLQQSSEARKKWWIRESAKHKPHIGKQEKPAAIAPWVHRKHDRPVKANARLPIMAVSQKSTSKEVPFWKRKNKNVSRDLAIKRHREVPWWEKAIPNTRAAKVVVSEKKKPENIEKSINAPVRNTFSNKPARNTFAMKPLRNTFANKPSRNTFVNKEKYGNRHVEHFHSQKKHKPRRNKFANKPVTERPIQSKIKMTRDLDTPPTVDFNKQLTEQELKQREMIEKQKRLQEEQLRLQIKQLEENNKRVIKKQQEEQERRMLDIERKHKLAVNKQKSFNVVQETNQNAFTTVPQSFEQVTSTISPPQSEKFSLFPDKNSKTDPWTRFVQFIIRNKP